MAEPFRWTAPSGAVITLPQMGRIKAGVIRRHRNKDGLDMAFSIIEDVADEETLAQIDDLVGDDLDKLAEAWMSGVSAGESSGSSTSSTNIVEPSNTTSAPGSTSA